MRGFKTDQIDTVLDARTVDAGHVQIEAPLVEYYYYSTHYGFPGLSYRYAESEYSWRPDFRVGLLNNVDFQVNPSYSIRSENVNGAYSAPYALYAFNSTTRSSGFGRVDFGPEINLWGNDGGATALAISPYLSVPTANGQVLAGMDIPFGVRVCRGLYLKLDTEFYLTDDSRGTRYGGFENNVSLTKKVCSKVSVYWYLDSTVTSDAGQSWYGYTGFGATYRIARDVELYASMGFGLNSAAYDYNPRFGVILRF
jgi:hypothetical protein